MIDVWGDGNQTRSFLYIDDCIDAILRLFKSDFSKPINIGSEEKVSINELINLIENISEYNVQKNYQLDMPKGVNGRSSDNSLIKKTLNWNYNFSLKQGITETYLWIEDIYKNKKNSEFARFTKSQLN